MKAAAFDYAVPKSVAEATALLGSNGAATAAIAGGQSLLPMLNLRVALPDLVVDLGRLEELKEIAATRTNIRVGALTTHAAIEDGKLPEAFGGLMQKVASKISYRAVRNHGTIGGSVALADPAADWPGCLLALGAQVRIAGRKGTRSQPIGEFVLGQYSTSLATDEIIVGFDVPRPGAALRWFFQGGAEKRRVCKFHCIRLFARPWWSGCGGTRRCCRPPLPASGGGRTDQSRRKV